MNGLRLRQGFGQKGPAAHGNVGKGLEEVQEHWIVVHGDGLAEAEAEAGAEGSG